MILNYLHITGHINKSIDDLPVVGLMFRRYGSEHAGRQLTNIV